nr:2Fe-2S iron-sulfur cluster-binding protein [Sphingomonas sp. Ant H11]
MSGPSRLPGGPEPTLRFTFDGVPLRARTGDTLAAELLANGIGLVARSFKYHRPRGILSAGVRSPMRWSRLAKADGANPIRARPTSMSMTASSRTAKIAGRALLLIWARSTGSPRAS